MDTSSALSAVDIRSNITLSNENKQQDRKQQHQYTKSKQRIKPQQKVNRPFSHVNSTIEDTEPMTITPETSENEENLVRVSHVKSPEHFYIQKVSDIQKLRELSNTYLDYAQGNRMTRILSEGYYYMTYHAKDKQWYRSILKKILPNDVYKMFLVDYGMHLETTKDK